MIKTRLVKLLSHEKKYIVYHVMIQWFELMAQILAIFSLTALLEKLMDDSYQRIDIHITVAILIAAMILRFAGDRLLARMSYLAGADVKRILREKIYEKMLRLGASYRSYTATSEIVQLAAEGVEQMETYFGKYLPQFFYSLLAPLTLFLILVFVSWKASLVLLICVPLIPISIVVVQKLAKRLLSKYWGIYAGLADSFLENLQGMTTLKIYQADQKKADEMDAEASRFRKITMKVLTMQLNSTSVMDIVAYGGAAAGIVVAVLEHLHGNVTLAGALTIVLLAAEFFIPLRLLGSYFHIAMNGMAASDKIFAFLDLPEPKQGAEAWEDRNTGIYMEEVCFGYRDGADVLQHVSVNLPAGSLISLVGESGCGKSTIAGILSGKNKDYRGRILLGERELAGMAEDELLKNITVVAHDSYLFKGTVEENLRMAKPQATEEELEEALVRVNLLDFLKTQNGLATELLERGANLSGGQRQRLALARALLHDTPIYIFDEATSNIDVESENRIIWIIRELAKTKTILLISHRLANVIDSDCIYMMEQGKVLEKGTHRQLMQMDGAYRKMFLTQYELEQYGKAVEA